MSVVAEDLFIPVQQQLPKPVASGSFGNLYQRDGIYIWRLEGMKNPVIDIQIIREALSAIHKVTQNNRTPLLVDLTCSGIPALTPTARACIMGNDFVRLRTAIAFLTTEVTRKTIFMHLVSFNKSNLPLKSFQNEEEAQNWLTTFLLN